MKIVAKRKVLLFTVHTELYTENQKVETTWDKAA
jgi:hypothetical protein